MATTLNISSLTDYVDSKRDEIFVKAVAGNKSLNFVDVIPDVVYKTLLNTIDSTVVLQDGSDCGWNPDGTDTLNERPLEVHPIAIQKEWCNKDLRKKFANWQYNWQAGRIALPFEEAFVESNMVAIQNAVENLVWQGDDSLGVTGWISDVTSNGTLTPIDASAATGIEEVIEMAVAGLSTEMLEAGVNIFMSYTDFRAYIAALNATCCANRQIIDANRDVLIYLGDSRIKLIPTAGLENQNVLVAATPNALVYGTDIVNSEAAYKMIYDEKEDKTLLKVDFTAGTAVRLIDRVLLINK